ncbi:hypothetical protein LguiA_032686 [Lonicera macranthoides]
MAASSTADDVKLLGGWPSPFSNRIQIALNLKSIPYDFIEETFTPKSHLLLKSNPVHKQIPVLFHHDKPICESIVILQYIDEVWTKGQSLLPSDSYDRAIARFWAAYIDDKWFPSLRQLTIFAQGEDAISAALKQIVEATAVVEGAFADCSKGKAYFGGDKIGYLDLVFGCFLGWLRLAEKVVGVDLLTETKTPGLVGWVERFSSNDAVKSVIQEPEKLMETLEFLKAMFNASTT